MDRRAAREAGLLPDDLLNSLLFRNVSAESVEGILDQCRIRELAPEEIFLVPGQANNRIHVLLSGKLRIHLETAESDPIAFLGVGETAGEMSVIDGSAVSAFVVADEACRLLEMGEETLWSLVQVSHAAAVNLLTILTRRLRHANEVIAERTKLYHEIQHFGTVDALTGLHNRHWLDRMLGRLLTRCQMGGKSLSLIMVDIDNFKTFNDRCGHLAGDRAIHAVAQTIVDHCRPILLATRYGGDEFIVILPEIDLARAGAVAERLRVAVAENTFQLANGKPLPSLTISAGVAEAGPEDTPEMLLAAADAALYRAKGRGRNCVST
jgi:diguanylate cyclase (GGDEF)-like protein